jgi:tetratricopeptide (TPR) repeat protein
MKEPSWRGGAIVGAYRILSHIGSGGMGEDSRLHRKVALKILPRNVTSDPKRLERFEREARAASALNHPAILTIHELGQDGQTYYIAGEYIEGETLRARMNRERLSVREAVEIASQMAAALSAAHAAGIVHRDIKPENVMLRPDGYVKVLDFGLAKLMPSNDAPADFSKTVQRATDPGTVVGTVNYMSPEQAKGNANVDARSDLFSLGAVVYELLAGRAPFEGQTSSHVIVSILERAPAPLSQAGEVPHELQRIVAKLLEKNPEERYQTAKDLLIDLRHLKHELEVSGETQWSAAAPGGAAPTRSRSSVDTLVSGIRTHKRAAVVSALLIAVIVAAALFVPPMLREAESGGERIPIAVADFDNQTGEKALDGLSGMLITSLEQSRRLSVMTRSRMFDTLRRLGKDNVARIDEAHGREIAQAENMRGLVTASVNKFGDLYIIDLKVVDPTSNEYVFAGKEQGKGQENIPELIDRLSERLRLALRESSQDVSKARKEVAGATTSNIEAYQHYFRGDEFIDDWQFEKAEEELLQAVKLDPKFGLAWARLAYVSSWSTNPNARERIAKARQFSAHATEKERLIISALEAEIAGKIPEAIAIRKRILERFPDDKESAYVTGDLSYHTYDYAAAREYLERVIQADARHERAHTHLVWTDWSTGNYAAGVEHARRFVAQTSSVDARSLLAAALRQNGAIDESLAELRATLTAHPQSLDAIGALAVALAHDGEYAEAKQVIERIKTLPEKDKRAAYEGLSMNIAVEEGRYRDAVAWAGRGADVAMANGLRPRAIEVKTARAYVHAFFGHPDEARAAAREVESVPTDLDFTIKYPLITTYLLLNDFEDARRLSENSNERRTFAGLIATRKALVARDFNAALQQARALTRANMWYGDSWQVHAEAALAAGQYDEAVQATNRMSAFVWPVFGAAIREYNLGRIEEARGNRAAAKTHYQSMLKHWRNADPDVPQLVDAKARLARL